MCFCDIGDYLRITIETVCRVLSDLKRRGVIEVSRIRHAARPFRPGGDRRN